MPPRQVYGKKRTARAGYDPDAIFGSLRCNKSSPDFKVLEAVEELATLKISDESRGRSGECFGNGNGALSPLDGNALPRLQDKHELDVTKNARPRRRRKVVTTDSEEESELEDHGDLHSSVNDAEPRTPPPFKNGKSTEIATGQPRTAAAPTRSPVKDEYTTHCADLLSLSSNAMTSFEDWTEQLSEHFHLTKIAEASFGEVYRLSLIHTLSGFSSSDESVLKIIPLRPPPNPLPLDRRKRAALARTMADMSSPSDVANEVKLLQRMSSIPGFTNFRDIRIIQGRPPASFQAAYKDFNVAQKARGKEPSHFADPKKKSSYACDQLWAVIEMQDAGMDLERLLETAECTSIFSIWDIFWQVVLSLAKGEEGAQFEHRDLHLGNICVREPVEPIPALDTSDLKSRKLHFTPVETTIIDYTLSRAELSNGTIAFHDLASSDNASLFTADSTIEYQYDMYRYMRGAVFRDDVFADIPTPESLFPSREPKSWNQYHPITNLIWLHYILYKLLEHMTWPSENRAPPRHLKVEHARWKRGIDLEHVLLQVQELLDPGRLGGGGGGDDDGEGGLRSVGILVGLALREGWLDVGDVVGVDNEGDEEEELVEELVEELAALRMGSRTAAIEEVDDASGVMDTKTMSGRRPGRRKE